MRRLLSLLLLPLLLSATCYEGNLWESQVELLARLGGERHGAGVDLWIPAMQNRRMVTFVQADFGWFHRMTQGSIGLGHRALWTRDFGYGLNGFLDYGRSGSGVNYYQGGLGGELFTQCWAARANGYWPVARKKLISTSIGLDNFLEGTQVFSNNTLFRRHERSYRGFDAELGRRLDVGPGELWAWAGYYFFDASDVKPVQGPRIRVEYWSKPMLRWGGTLYFAGEWQYNRIHKSDASAIVGVRFPLCGYGKCPCWCMDGITRFMGRPVWRERAIWTERETEAIDLAPEFITNLFFVNAVGGGTGTQSSPYSVAQLNAASTAGDLVVLLGTGIPGTIAMEENMQVGGFGNGDALNFTVGNQTITVEGSGRGELDGGGITLNNNNTIFSISIINSANAIDSSGPTTNGTITDVHFDTIGTAGINVDDPNGRWTITNNQITSSAAANLIVMANTVDNNALTIVARGNTVDSSTGLINFSDTSDNSATDLLIDSNTFTTASAPITIDYSAGGSGTSLNTIISNNELAGSGAITIASNMGNNVSSITGLINNNTFASATGAVIDITAEDEGIIGFTVQSNSDTGSGAAVDPYQFTTGGAGTPGELCLAITGNSTDRAGQGISLDQANTPMNVEQISSLNTDNTNTAEVGNVMPVATTGSPQNAPVGSCPTVDPID